MHMIDLPILKDNGLARYKYLVGPYSVGIIPPSRDKHLVSIKTVRDAWHGAPIPNSARSHNGMHDSRVTPEEIANYILQARLY